MVRPRGRREVADLVSTSSQNGTNRPYRGGLTMSVYRARPEVIGAQPKRRF